jgi:hypothetical protein
VNKETGQHAAVKIIDKSTIEPEEKGLLRTEIAGVYDGDIRAVYGTIQSKLCLERLKVLSKEVFCEEPPSPLFTRSISYLTVPTSPLFCSAKISSDFTIQYPHNSLFNTLITRYSIPS